VQNVPRNNRRFSTTTEKEFLLVRFLADIDISAVNVALTERDFRVPENSSKNNEGGKLSA
jgi:hypothetical protein